MATDLRGALAKLAEEWRHQIDHQLKPDAADWVLRYCHNQVSGLLAAHPQTDERGALEAAHSEVRKQFGFELADHLYRNGYAGSAVIYAIRSYARRGA